MDAFSELVCPSEYEFPSLLQNEKPVPIVEKMTSVFETDKNTDLLLLSSNNKKPLKQLLSTTLMTSNVESHQQQTHTIPPFSSITDSSYLHKPSGLTDSSGHTLTDHSKTMMEQAHEEKSQNEQYFEKLKENHLKMFSGNLTTEKNIPVNDKLFARYQTIDREILLIKKGQEKRQQIPPKIIENTAAIVEKIPTENNQQDFNYKQKKKRKRTSFSIEQLLALEKKYEICPYINREKRMVFAEKIGVPEKKIKTWFQNRRMKEKKISNGSSDNETAAGVKLKNVETSDEDDSCDEINEVDDGGSYRNKKVRIISYSDDEKNSLSIVKNKDTIDTQVSSNKTNYLKLFLEQLDFIDKQYEENGAL